MTKKDHKWPKYIIEFTEWDDLREKSAFCENVESDDPLPIPAVGDTVNLDSDFAEGAIMIHVERRRFSYHQGWSHVQLFCRKHDFDKSSSYEGP